MQWLGRAAAAVVAVFLLTTVGMLVVRSRAVRERAAPAPPGRADASIRELRVREHAGRATWLLEAERAQMFDAEGRTALERVRVEVVDGPQRWTITGDAGDLHREPKRIELRGHVVVVTTDGFRLEAVVLRWDAASGRITSDQPVRVVKERMDVRGGGIEMVSHEETAAIKGPVRATFHPARSSR